LIKRRSYTDCPLFIYVILFATAIPAERYTNENTFLFINPNVNKKIHVKDFTGMIYWKVNDNGYCAPYREEKPLQNIVE